MRGPESTLDTIRDFLHLFGTIEGITEIIRWGGLGVLVAIVFSETGLLVGFFLPGDSLLVTAGFVASTTGALEIGELLVALPLAAIAGNSTGYLIGRKAGQALYHRPETRWFKRKHLLETKAFYEKYGVITIVMAQFMPFARTFAPVVAGIGEMRYRTFALFNVVGALAWVVSMTLLGYYFGQIPFVQRHIEKVILLVIAISVAPVAIQAWRMKRAGAAADRTK